MQQAPSWLPYRLRNWLDQQRILRAIRGLDGTQSYPAAQPSDADLEVHMLLCARDLRIGIVAAKSLLRFGDGRMAVTFSDDGTLTGRDRAWVDQHIPHARWLSWPTQDPLIDNALTNRPHLRDLYESDYAPVCKLMHAMAMPRCERVMVVDPDTAFFKPPDTILDWMRSDDKHAWYLHDHQDESSAVPPQAQQAFAQLEAELATDDRPWTLDRRLFNSGLLVFEPARFDLDLCERYLAWRPTLDVQYRTGKCAIWFGDWTPEQTCYHVMFALAQPPSRPLGDAYHLGGQAGHVFNHFLRHYLVRKGTHDRLRQLVAAL